MLLSLGRCLFVSKLSYSHFFLISTILYAQWIPSPAWSGFPLVAKAVRKEKDWAHIYNATPNGSPTQWSVTVKMDYRAESSQTLSRVCCTDADVKQLTNTTATAPESLQRFRFFSFPDCQPNFSVFHRLVNISVSWITLFLGPYSGFTV